MCAQGGQKKVIPYLDLREQSLFLSTEASFQPLFVLFFHFFFEKWFYSEPRISLTSGPSCLKYRDYRRASPKFLMTKDLWQGDGWLSLPEDPRPPLHVLTLWDIDFSNQKLILARGRWVCAQNRMQGCCQCEHPVGKFCCSWRDRVGWVQS